MVPALLVKWVMKTDSPLMVRLAADSSLSISPASGREPSPILVSKVMPSSIQFITPASATTVSPRSSPISTTCMSSPWI
jgi:hypothetical protein